VQSLASGDGDAIISDEFTSIEGVSTKAQREACEKDAKTFEKLSSNAMDMLASMLERIVSSC
jgi:hypothetical protein